MLKGEMEERNLRGLVDWWRTVDLVDLVDCVDLVENGLVGR